MKKTLLMVSMLAATIANAETFSTSADVTKVLIPLSITQKTAMVLPQVQVDESTPEGEVICTSDSAAYPSRNYCTGTYNNGIYTVSGSPFADVSLVVEKTSSTVVDGISFQAFYPNISQYTRPLTLASDGNFDVEVRGYLTIADKTAVVSQNYVFDFDLTAVYQ